MRVLLTGATGFLGKELYSNIREAGHTVLGLSRHGPDVVGDITKPDLGLKHPPKVDAVVHSAPLLSFSQHNREKLFKVNTEGTFNVCRFCLNNHIPYLAYISTAYVCGDFKGTWKEEHFDKWQTFRNPYESSKFQGEMVVRSLPKLKSSIIRPSIIIGRSTDGKATAFEGFYAPIRAIAKCMALMEGKLKLPHREKVEKFLHIPFVEF